eukprot:c23285_g7_i2 orf=182-973(+)
MCQMISEALLLGRSMVSCSSKAFHESLTASESSSCSFLSASRATGNLRAHQWRVSGTASSRMTVFCQVIAPLSKHEQHINLNSCNADQQTSSPDRWMEDCVCDIVRNIDEAPFLHMLFDSKDSSAAVTSQRQRVVDTADLSIEEKWKEVKDCVSKASPDGVILVHHLDDEIMEGCCLQDSMFPDAIRSSRNKERCTSTDLWGVLVLGKKITSSACYILKTTSVASSFGTCTQFCLTKAKCFGPCWHEQVQTSWLLNTEDNEQN